MTHIEALSTQSGKKTYKIFFETTNAAIVRATTQNPTAALVRRRSSAPSSMSSRAS